MGRRDGTIFPGHNEVVIEGGDTWEGSLPQAIEAFYYETRFEGAEAIARSLRDAFVTRHRLSAEAVPLLVLDRTDWDMPFSLAATTATARLTAARDGHRPCDRPQCSLPPRAFATRPFLGVFG